jgi:UDP-3-O-[3-hydroxymyristoyl] glucosamine N-acyltransferase
MTVERTLSQIAHRVKGELHGRGDLRITDAAPFETATAEQITYAASPKFLKRLEDTRAGAVLVSEECHAGHKPIIRVANPQLAFAQILEWFYPRPAPPPGKHASACIGAQFQCGQDVHIGPYVAIGDGVKLGNRVTIHSHVHIAGNVQIGNEVEIFPNVTILERCQIGNRVTIQAGSVIGADGFGYAPDSDRYHKIPHTGIVQIDDDVEIGACNTIDRATFGKTWIQRGVKTDNLVHIAHNVSVGEDTVLVAQVGVAGSVTIGRHAILAGQAGVAGHIEIGDNAIIGPQAGIAKSVAKGLVVSGSPEMPHQLWLRVQRIIPQLPQMKKKISALEKRLRACKDRQM